MLARAVFEVLGVDAPQAETRLGRKYTLIIQSDETAHYLTIYRSGKERAPTIHANLFTSFHDLLVDARQKIMRRFHHGYTLTWWDEEFPFMDWIAEQGYRRKRLDIMPPPVQLHLSLPQRKTGHTVGENY
jgi:hypothetical protein